MREGWARVAFGDVVRLSRERSSDPITDGFDRYVGLEHLDPGDLKIRRWGNTADGTTFTNIFRPGQILFGKRRAYQRKVAVAEFSGVCSGDIYAFEVSDPRLLPGLLPFVCDSDTFAHHAVETSAGSLSPRTNWASLAEFRFHLPPMEEQARLLDAFESVRQGTEALYVLQERIGVVRAALSDSVHESSAGDEVEIGDLIATRSISLQTGPFGTVLRASSYSATGHPLINPVDMDGGEIRADRAARVDDEVWRRLEKYWIRGGDLLLGRKRHMRNLVLAKPEHDGFIVGSDSIRIRVQGDVIDSRYLFHLLRSKKTQHWLQTQAAGNGTVMPGMNEQILGRLRIWLPPVARQREIAALHQTTEEASALVDARRDAVRGLIGRLSDLSLGVM